VGAIPVPSALELLLMDHRGPLSDARFNSVFGRVPPIRIENLFCFAHVRPVDFQTEALPKNRVIGNFGGANLPIMRHFRRIADCFRVDCYPVKTCRLDIMGLLPRLPSIVGRGLFLQAGLDPGSCRRGRKREWRVLTGICRMPRSVGRRRRALVDRVRSSRLTYGSTWR